MNTDSPTEGARATSAALEPPGGVLVWIVIFLETLTFAAGLALFVASGRSEPSVFAAGRAALLQPLAFANTLVLLTGGWAMAAAIRALRVGATARARRFTLGAIASGTAFVLLKTLEWSRELGHGYGPHHDTFFTYYWFLTGFHFLHVVVAVVILLAIHRGIARGRITAKDHGDAESGAAFWHMCDLIWLVLYPTIYLLG